MAFISRSPDTATAEEVRRFQLHQTETGVRPPIIAAGINLFGGPLGLLHRHVTGAMPIRRNTREAELNQERDIANATAKTRAETASAEQTARLSDEAFPFFTEGNHGWSRPHSF